MPQTYFPLRWESPGDQWWFASPIDWAAANGHYDLVRELLHIDANQLIKLTSLRRIRRLETVWDDEDKERCNDIAKCRSQVAQKLLQECEMKQGYNSLIRAGYGGWLLYTAASAGDLIFVKEMLDRYSLLVFGEGEYGVTDIFYAAARSKSCEVFRLLLDCAMSPKGQPQVEISSSVSFKWELMNRAVHAAARGENIDMLRELLLEDCSDVLAYRDGQGSTLLHTASGRGQVEVVKYLISTYKDIILAVDDRGNTALHVAAFWGHLAALQVLASASPSSVSMANNYGDTLLHTAVAGFSTPSFKRLDRQMELMKQLIVGKMIDIGKIINATNREGRTALHMATAMPNIQFDIVEMFVSADSIDLNIPDARGNTPVDLLKQRTGTASSKILIKRLITAGGIMSNGQDRTTWNAVVSSCLRAHGIGVSPGNSFKIPDAELILHAGLDTTGIRASGDFTTTECCSYSGEIEHMESKHKEGMSPLNRAARHLKIMLRWPRAVKYTTDSEDNCSIKSYRMCSTSTNNPVSLRQQFAKPPSTPTNKRILSLQGNLPASPSSKKKFSASAASLTQSVGQVLPKSNLGSPLSTYSESCWSSPASTDMRKSTKLECSCRSGSASAGPSSSNQSPNLEKLRRKHYQFNLKSVNKVFLFGRSSPAGC